MSILVEACVKPETSCAGSLGVELDAYQRSDSPELCAPLLEAQAFDQDGFFCALALPRDSTEELVRRLAGALRATSRALCSLEPDHVLVLVQGPEATTSDAQLTPVVGCSPVGIGLRRRGPEGAAQTAVEAVQALSLAMRRGGLVRVEDEWPLLLLLRSLADVHGYIAPAIAFARTRPHLAEAVRAYADAGFSVTGAAQRLYLTPNAVVYRLRQWATGTGWDARSYKGLVRSLACLEMLALEGSVSPPEARA
ncbi:MAG: helix-turn-helix domain-containing protein [Mycobacteriales bacterium]